MRDTDAPARSPEQWEPFMESLRGRLAAAKRGRRLRRAAGCALAAALALALAGALEQAPPSAGRLLLARIPAGAQATFVAEGSCVRPLASGEWVVGCGGGTP